MTSTPRPSRALEGSEITGASSLEDFVSKLTAPRAVWLMLPAAITGEILEQVAALLEPGDIVIDGGNSFYQDDINPRERSLYARSICTTSTAGRVAGCGDWSAATAS
jgi:6-phosphogluconate dehydrogenase